MTEDEFFERATLSQVPIVNTYLKENKLLYHDGNIVTAIEAFFKWYLSIKPKGCPSANHDKEMGDEQDK